MRELREITCPARRSCRAVFPFIYSMMDTPLTPRWRYVYQSCGDDRRSPHNLKNLRLA
ncbi:hypothetical protein CKO_03750 [Citrobacter koseri ATCC BAA-895]|uniref:Uncharacterized protein n=1 Tax=Citrobacter koseri (strain ATCC BAA-895 / CDC 4225-83 / SGSC4696) TaxID=290338 RepID=A8AMW3_CITK8|nr:hypothetical protein CKO_03750 [Citrobacter koseri ATCC BAA-895]